MKWSIFYKFYNTCLGTTYRLYFKRRFNKINYRYCININDLKSCKISIYFECFKKFNQKKNVKKSKTNKSNVYNFNNIIYFLMSNNIPKKSKQTLKKFVLLFYVINLFKKYKVEIALKICTKNTRAKIC